MMAEAASEYVRKLHFMWLDRNDCECTKPPLFVTYTRDEWARAMPTWKITFWNWNSISRLISSTSELAPLHDQILDSSRPNIEVADLARLAVLFAEGGVYLDLKVRPKLGYDVAWRDLYPNRQTLYSYEPTTSRHCGYVMNGVLAARTANQPFWIGFLQYILDGRSLHAAKTSGQSIDAVHVTGPFALKNYIDLGDTTVEPPLQPCHTLGHQNLSAGLRPESEQDCSVDTPQIVDVNWKHSTQQGRNVKLKAFIAGIVLASLVAATGIIVLIVWAAARRW